MQVEILTKEDLKEFKAELVQELKDAFGGNAKITKQRMAEKQRSKKAVRYLARNLTEPTY